MSHSPTGWNRVKTTPASDITYLFFFFYLISHIVFIVVSSMENPTSSIFVYIVSYLFIIHLICNYFNLTLKVLFKNGVIFFRYHLLLFYWNFLILYKNFNKKYDQSPEVAWLNNGWILKHFLASNEDQRKLTWDILGK